MAFRIERDDARHLLLVVYPAQPTKGEVAAYLREVKAEMTVLASLGPWRCLVDQRELKLLDPVLVDHIATINAWAAAHGMERSARLVTGALARLQASRIARAAELETVRSFDSHEEAMAWLLER